MKKLRNYILAITVFAITPACANRPLKNDVDLVLLIDQSDPLKVTPDADQIVNQLGITQDIWQGVRVTITYVSNTDVNASKVVVLEKAKRLSGNTQLRTAEVSRFKKDLRTALASTYSTGSLDHSIIYRTVAKQLNALSTSAASNRMLLVYSDLMENDDIDFYNPMTLNLLHNHPDIIRQQFAKSAALSNLSGVQVWLLYEPPSYKANGIYMSIARIYKRLLESKGAQVHIEKTLNL